MTLVLLNTQFRTMNVAVPKGKPGPPTIGKSWEINQPSLRLVTRTSSRTYHQGFWKTFFDMTTPGTSLRRQSSSMCAMFTRTAIICPSSRNSIGARYLVKSIKRPAWTSCVQNLPIGEFSGSGMKFDKRASVALLNAILNNCKLA